VSYAKADPRSARDESSPPDSPVAGEVVNPRGAWVSLVVWCGGFLFLIVLLLWDFIRPLFGL
jgi:hypothetical protein